MLEEKDEFNLPTFRSAFYLCLLFSLFFLFVYFNLNTTLWQVLLSSTLLSNYTAATIWKIPFCLLLSTFAQTKVWFLGYFFGTPRNFCFKKCWRRFKPLHELKPPFNVEVTNSPWRLSLDITAQIATNGLLLRRH